MHDLSHRLLLNAQSGRLPVLRSWMRTSSSEHVCSSSTCSSVFLRACLQQRAREHRARNASTSAQAEKAEWLFSDAERGFGKTRSALQLPLRQLDKLASPTHVELRARHNMSKTFSFDCGRSPRAHRIQQQCRHSSRIVVPRPLSSSRDGL